jgi:hypothetical protein
MKLARWITIAALAARTACADWANDFDSWWFASGGAAASTDVTNGMIGWWKFDGNASATVGGTSGTVYQATQTTGKIGQCYDFDGVDDYVQITGFANTGTTQSVSFWVYPHTTAQQQFLLDIQTGRLIFEHCGDGTELVAFFDGATTRNWGAPASITNWHHLVWVADGAAGQINHYKDGILQATANQTYTARAIGGAIRIGTRYEPYLGNSYPFNGLIDDVRIYNRALASNEVYTIWNLYK